MDIFTTDYLPHTGSGNPMAVAHSYCYKLLPIQKQVCSGVW